MDSSNALILELVKGLIEANDKKTLGPYLKRPEQEESVSGETQMPELTPEELAALEEDDSSMEA